MAYTKNTWVDRVAVGDNKFTDQNGNNYEFTPNPDSVSQAGTPFSAAWMNHIEQGIADAVPQERTINGYNLSANRTLTAHDVGAPVVYSSVKNIPGITTSDNLLVIVRDRMASESILMDAWVGSGVAGYSAYTTLTNDLPTPYGCLLIFHGNSVYPNYLVFIGYNNNLYYRTIDYCNSTLHDSGWFQTVPTTRKIGGVALTSDITLASMNAQTVLTTTTGTLSYSNFTNSGSYVRKYGHVVTLNIAGTASAAYTQNADKQIATCPSGYRPAANTQFMLTRGNTGQYTMYGYVNTSGQVIVHPTASVASGEYIYGSVTFLTS